MFVKFTVCAVIAAVLCSCCSEPLLPEDKGDAEAAKWLKMAAEDGNLYAQYYYAECCLAGDGVPADRPEAIRVLKLAASNGSIEASELLQKIASEKALDQ